MVTSDSKGQCYPYAKRFYYREGMNDWREVTESWERLIWARERWQTARGVKPSKSDAADALGMKFGTYAAYEREPGQSKHTVMDHQHAISFARKFKCDWVWLLTGEGSPDAIQPSSDEIELLRTVREQPETRRRAFIEAIQLMFRQAG